MNTDNTQTSTGLATSDVEQRAKDDLNAATETVRHDLDAVTQRAAEDAKALKEEAKVQIDAAAEKAKSFAGEHKDIAASQITGLAAAVSKVATELEGDQATTARYARDLANGLDRFGKTVEGKSVDDLMGMAQQFGRSQPLAFLGAAALAGFVASRFAGATAHRAAQSSQGAARTTDTNEHSSYDEASETEYTRTGNGNSYQPNTGYAGGGNVSGS